MGRVFNVAAVCKPDSEAIDIALMFRFVKVNGEKVEVANRIFEMYFNDERRFS